MLSLFALCGLVFLDAPILAMAWSARPFLGFTVESTLVVSHSRGDGWINGKIALDYPQRVIQVGDRVIRTPMILLKRFLR